MSPKGQALLICNLRFGYYSAILSHSKSWLVQLAKSRQVVEQSKSTLTYRKAKKQQAGLFALAGERSQKNNKERKRMVYFVVTILVPWVMLMFVAGMAISSADTAGEKMLSFLWILWVTVPYTLLGLWGIGAVWLERRQQALADQVAEIKKSSRHYRFNRWMHSSSWQPPASECRYWADFFNALFFLTPVLTCVVAFFYVLLGSIRFIGAVVGFMIGFQPAWGSWDSLQIKDWFASKGYFYKHQFWGPGLALTLVAFWFFWGNPDSAPVASAVSVLLMAVAGIGIVVWILRRVIWRGLQGLWFLVSAVWQAVFVSGFGALFNYLLVRRLTCRKIRYVP